jgi:hypothetical protein
VDAAGRVVGQFAPTGIRPKLMERIARAGVDSSHLSGSWG